MLESRNRLSASARELLADGRGELVPSPDPQSIAGTVVELFSDDAKRSALCELAAAHGRRMVWPAAARRYARSFEHARAGEQYAPRVSRRPTVDARFV